MKTSRSQSSNSQSQGIPMKSAAPKDNHSTEPTFDESIGSIADSIAWFFSRPAALYKWLTAPTGGQRIILGSMTLYFWAVSAEAYWQALSVGEQFVKTGKLDTHNTTTHPSFVPKPFSPNTGNLQNAGVAFGDPSFYVTSVLSLVILGVQANLQRGKKSITQAKAEYEAVKNFRVGDVPKDAIDVVQYEAKAYKQAGSHDAKSVATAVKASYAVDIAANAASYWTFFFSGMSGAIPSIVWVWAGVFGAEHFLKLWNRNEEMVKHRSQSKRFPRVIPFGRKSTDSKSETN